MLITLFIAIFFFTSCSLGGSRTAMLNKANDGKKADNWLEQIIEIINSKDKESLKGLFSEQALTEADHFDENIEYLYDFLNGEIKSWERAAGPVISENINRGYNKKVSQVVYFLFTESNKFQLYFLEYIIDTDYPENVGIFMLRVINSEDEDTPIEWGGDTHCAGIYRPDEVDVCNSEELLQD